MTYESTVAAARPRPGLWAISRYRTSGDAFVDLPVSWEDLDRDTVWAASILSTFSASADDWAVLVSMFEEAPWIRPFEQSLQELGAVCMGADALAVEAGRAGAYLRRLPIRVVIGLRAAVLDGLSGIAPLSELFRDVRLLFACPDAHPALRQLHLQPLLWLPIGPALAVECAAREGAHVNGEEWAIESVDGQIHVTTVGPRALRVDRQPVDLRGAVARGACACGRDDPRLVPITEVSDPPARTRSPEGAE